MSFEPGAPVQDGYVPLCVPELRGLEWKYVTDCLNTNWVSSLGTYVTRFEKDLAAYIGGAYGVATVNGTAALHVALELAGVAPGDEVAVSTLTFIAPANAIRYAGAWPVFIDAEPDYWQIDPAKLAAFLDNGCERRDGALWNKATGRRVAAVLPVHILGHPVDLDPVIEAARRYSLPVIEDASESLGAEYKGKKVGSLGDVACFSFNGNKLITTGGGGMIVTNNEDWAKRAKYLTTQAKDDPIEYVHNEIGYNYRLTNIQAALGCAQFEQIGPYIEKKRLIAVTYAQAFADVPGIATMPEAGWAFSSYWLYTVLVDEQAYGMNSRALLRALGAAEIQARPLWQPMHQSPAHRAASHAACPVADRLCRDALSLPCSVGLTDREQQRVCEAIARAGR